MLGFKSYARNRIAVRLYNIYTHTYIYRVVIYYMRQAYPPEHLEIYALIGIEESEKLERLPRVYKMMRYINGRGILRNYP